MDAWVCQQCRATHAGGDRVCARCGAALDPDGPTASLPPWSGVTVMRDVRDDAVSAALAGRAGGAGSPVLEPFFRLERAPRWPALHRITRLWPVLVFLVVLLFFAIAGLQR